MVFPGFARLPWLTVQANTEIFASPDSVGS
jgi:hypothetical protein